MAGPIEASADGDLMARQDKIHIVADVVTFFLFDDMKVLQSLIVQEHVFHALRFK